MGVQLLGFKITDNEMRDVPAFGRAILAEVIGTFYLIFIGCGGVAGAQLKTLNSEGNFENAGVLQIGFAFGLGIGGAVHLFSDISGGQFNPAVSFGLFFAKQLSLLTACVFTVAQVTGGLIACGILKGLLGTCPGVVSLGTKLGGLTYFSAADGFLIEFLGTLFLVLTVLSTTNDRRQHSASYLQPLSIGIAIFVLHMFLVPTTGCGLNPARSFVTNVVENKIQSYFYVYIIGPMLASVAGGLLYEFVFNPHYRPAVHVITDDNGKA